MARPLTRWLGLTALALVVLGVFYLPPRGVPKWAASRLLFSDINPSRLRAKELARAWGQANALLQEARYRARIDSALAARHAKGSYGPVLLVEGPDSLRQKLETALQADLDTVWHRLGLGETKVSVAVVSGEPLKTSDQVHMYRYSMSSYGISYVLPDTGSHTSCLSLSRYPFWMGRGKYISPRYLRGWAEQVLGPCAFYARFGVPGSRVEQWLGNRLFDVVLMPTWHHPPARVYAGGDDEDMPPVTLLRWMWRDWVYNFPPQTAACYAGRAPACQRAIAAGDHPLPGAPRPRAVLPRDAFATSRILLNGASEFLSGVLRDVGPERFQDFWITTLPVDSALTLALHEPVADYTARYQRTLGAAPRFGASARPLDAALSIIICLVIVALTLAAQGRREVR